MKMTASFKLWCCITALAWAGISAALVVPAGTAITNFMPVILVDSLIISGTVVMANMPAMVGGDLTRRIIVTNGNFVLAGAGAITRASDLMVPNIAGVPGVPSGTAGQPGGAGGAGTGTGPGGAGGAGGSNPALAGNGFPGGAGGTGGALAGDGGNGGAGGAGNAGNPSGGPGGNGADGGTGGGAGSAPNVFTVIVVNTTCGGAIHMDSPLVNLTGGNGGDGGNGGAGGNGGMGGGPGSMGGAGGMGGAVLPGTAGGRGAVVQLYASNGTVRIGAYDLWVRGGAGGGGGTGGAGGAGGSGAMMGGNGGNGSSGGNGGAGGAGGSLSIVAGKVYTNTARAAHATIEILASTDGVPGVPGMGGAGGAGGPGTPPGMDGTPGASGNPGTSGSFGALALAPDSIAPTSSGDPVILPADAAVLFIGTATSLVFNSAAFGDNMTSTSCLLHTRIEVVETNAALGAATATIATSITNDMGNRTVAFTPALAWQDKQLCFRFITRDAGDNITTTTWGATTHDFTVVPEPAALVVLIAGAVCLMRHARSTRR
ncbi:MAG: hypothetical protein NTV22_07485 [bacterium]|nr:hypothetical protein [bacterium]